MRFSNQELRPILTGLNIKINGDYLEVIATDSYRLAKKNIKLDQPVQEDVNIVIPGKNIIELEHSFSRCMISVFYQCI